MLRRLFITCASLLAFSCIGSGEPPSMSVQVAWDLNDPSATLPEGIDQLSIDIEIEGEDEPTSFIRSVSGLMDADGNGRDEILAPCDPSASSTCEGLPTDVDIRITIQGLSGGAVTHIGHAGPFVLRAGERRYVDLAMFQVGSATAVDRTPLRGRFFHTATALPDGRVLVAGGFSNAARTPCPAEVLAESRCYALTATSEAWVYDPSSARFHAIPGGSLEPRGGHSATALPDGRVLLTGGASDAILAFIPQGPPAMTTGYGIAIFGRDTTGADTALATFEIFDPEAGPELEDVGGDGDPGRGAFVGAADDPTEPGRLDAPRLFAAAAAVPGTSRVVVAGGTGDVNTTFAVFDADRAGGYGVLTATTPSLAASRVAASAIGVGSGTAARVWIFGGNAAASDAELAEVWSGSTTNPSGTSVSASTAPLMFPQQTSGGAASHPEWSFLRPVVEAVDGGDHVVVVGWYGPRCTITTPPVTVFAGADPTEACGFSATPPRAFTVDISTGLAAPTPLRSGHAFGASARLDDGRVVVTGGVSDLLFTTHNAVDVLTGAVGSDGAAVVLPPGMPMRTRRAFHTSTALPDGGVLTVGGATFPIDLSAITVVAASEVTYLPR